MQEETKKESLGVTITLILMLIGEYIFILLWIAYAMAHWGDTYLIVDLTRILAVPIYTYIWWGTAITGFTPEEETKMSGEALEEKEEERPISLRKRADTFGTQVGQEKSNSTPPKMTRLTDEEERILGYHMHMARELGLTIFSVDESNSRLPSAYLKLSKEDRLKVYRYLANIDRKLSMGELLTDEEIRQTKEYTSKYPGVY